MKWIKVSERLPKENKDVLIYTPSYSFKIIDVSWLQNGKWFNNYDHDSEAYFYEDGEVTHWAELPEPPKD